LEGAFWERSLGLLFFLVYAILSVEVDRKNGFKKVNNKAPAFKQVKTASEIITGG